VPTKSKKKDHLFIDSLLEWASTAGLHLQTRHFSGKDKEDISLAHGAMHAAILEKLEISPEQFAADTDPSTRVSGIFTDGSYKMSNLTRGSLLAPMDVLRHQGVSGAAVVYLGTPEHWEKAPARFLRIVSTDKADEMDAFCSELIGITMGTRVTEGLLYHITLYSDCMAAIARSHTTFAPRPKAMGHLRNGPICDILCQQSLVMLARIP
jgi:hypothetical protein